MVYEYRCNECGAAFEVTATVEEKTKGLYPTCPACGSKKTSQVFGGFGILAGGRAADSPRSSAGFPGMGFPGGGCCGPGRIGGC